MKKLILILAFLLIQTNLSAAKQLIIKDVLERTITLEKPASRIILSEGRYLTTLALLDKENPIKRIVGMLNPLRDTNPVLEKKLKEKFTNYDKIKYFGLQNADSISTEKIITLQPDLAIFGIKDHGPGAKNKELINQLQKAGIKIIFIDFRMNPLQNTVPSIQALGKALGKEENANKYIQFYQQRIKKIKKRLSGYTGKKPTVFLQAHIGRFDCCVGMASGMLGPFINLLGGKNISTPIAPGPTGRHSMEFLLTENPDVWIGTVSGTKEEFENGKVIPVLGPTSNKNLAQKSLKRALSSPAMQSLKAVQTGRAHGIWHNFYNSPFNIVAIESFAKWINPELFKDLTPDKTMLEIYDQFLIFKLDGIYLTTLEK
ncbi:iron-siderophore ABC transporter substrate-binding protein YiuA [Hyphomicrobiales bacterium 4NK60-0047b]|jgi:iron complex transport system substrate-binding protein